MRLILLLTIAPLLALAQHPNRPATRAPGQFWRAVPEPVRSGARPPVPPAPLGLRAPGVGFTGINPGALRSHSSGRRNRRNSFVGYSFIPYYSYGDYGNGFYDAPPYAPLEDPNVSASADPTANLLGEQIQRLSAQVEQLRNEQQTTVTPPPVSASRPPQEAPPVAPITVVLRDGGRLQVASYAVMDQVFWDFSQQPARRIPLANIDVAASTKATEAAGAEFPELNTRRPLP
jgi:hypothetical protein